MTTKQYYKDRENILAKRRDESARRKRDGICVHCGKNPILFFRSKSRCEDCLSFHNSRAKVYRENNKEKVRQSQKNSESKNPSLYRNIKKKYWKNNKDKWSWYARKRRAAKLRVGGYFTKDEWRILCDKYGNRCLRCGSGGILEPDHIVPISKGGSNTIGNIQPLCGTCNKWKSTKTIDFRPIFDLGFKESTINP